MPIYEYQCSACGHRADVLRKFSDAPLTTCPTCGRETFDKQLSAAGFQLKGSGWYATDFKQGTAAPAAKDAPATTETAKATADTAAAAPAAAAPAASHACGTGGCGSCA